MRSSLFAVGVLVFVLAASSFSPTAAQQGSITIVKVTTNGDTTTVFYFFVTEPDGSQTQFGLRSGDKKSEDAPNPGKYTVQEEAGSGDWILTVFCKGLDVPQPSTFEYITGGVIIRYEEGDTVDCSFTNSPLPVGGAVMPANTFALVAPWLAVLGLLCIGTIAVVVRKRR